MRQIDVAKKIILSIDKSISQIDTATLTEIVGRAQNEATRIDDSIDELSWFQFAGILRSLNHLNGQIQTFKARLEQAKHLVGTPDDN